MKSLPTPKLPPGSPLNPTTLSLTEPNNAGLNNTESDPNIRAVSDVDNVCDAGVVSGTGAEMYKGSDNE